MVAMIPQNPEDMIDIPVSHKKVDYENGAANIPEWRADRDPLEDYPDVEDDVRIWKPLTENDERLIPMFMWSARSALTHAQIQYGVPDDQAVENSCSGNADQHIFDVLHDSEYTSIVALKTLITKEIPRKVSDRWTSLEMNLFQQGLTQCSKDFAAIRANLLPHKTTMELVEHYYSWKRLKHVKGVAASRARVFLRRRQHPKSTIIGLPTSGIMTRGKLACKDTSGTLSRVSVTRKTVCLVPKRRKTSAK